MASSPPVVRVALDTPVDRLFDYLAADATEADVGRRVRVPFGRRETVGIVVALAAESALAAGQLRAVIEIDRGLPPLPPEVRELAGFAAAYYQHPLGPTLLGLLPPALKRARFRAPSAEAYVLTAAGRAHCHELSARATAQRRLAGRLDAGPVSLGEATALRPLLREWLRQGWVTAARETEAGAARLSGPELTSAQAAAVAAIAEAGPGFVVWLLHGVTGSGKTEVYLRLIETVLASGGQVLVLVPEIHLTPQIVERFAGRFPGRRLVSLHSGLADGERLAGWLDCLAGGADIVLGTRLAVFTPLPRLRLIIVDEEHDASYKQMEGLRYHARDVAVWRARQESIGVVLGSATPALETWANSRRGRYRLLSLPERAHAEASLPPIRLVDSRTDKPREGLSLALLDALQACLDAGEQSLVYINRRGYAPVLYCNACGFVSQCPRCSAHQVLHRRRSGYELRCHHCGLVSRPPPSCPDCGSLDLRPVGQGTQKVEETLAERFPSARILRLDRDSTARKGAFAAMRQAIAARQVDILVGTQIVAKGHDFPQLTLVGVIGADQALMSPDFRAGERLFAQLMQVAGRAGRAEHPGRVLIQTAYPHHPLYQALIAHDYPAFARRTLRERQAAAFPPYSFQALLRADARSMAAALDFLATARRLGVEMDQPVTLYDPVPAIMPRVADRERAQLLVQSSSRPHLQAFLKPWVAALRALPSGAVRWSLDVDPVDA